MVVSAVGVGRRFAGWAVAGRCCAGHGCFYRPIRRGTVYGADRRAASRKFHAAPTACPQCRCPGRERCPARLAGAGGSAPLWPRRGSLPGAWAASRWPVRGAVSGAAVLDAGGRYAGIVTAVDGDTCTVALVRTAGLCGAYAGLVTPGTWQLTGLPADCGLAAGDVVTTPSGDWLGTLAAIPMPDADGLTASAALPIPPICAPASIS